MLASPLPLGGASRVLTWRIAPFYHRRNTERLVAAHARRTGPRGKDDEAAPAYSSFYSSNDAKELSRMIPDPQDNLFQESEFAWAMGWAV